MSPRVLQRDTTCPNGGVFYTCNTGFAGCCLAEACNPGGCPQDKDVTPDERSKTISSTVAKVSMTSMSNLTPTTVVVASSVSTPLSTFAPPIASSTEQGPQTTSPAAASDGKQLNNGYVAPAAAIVGGILGGIIFSAVLVGLCVCARRKERTKVYKAATYPSPHVGSDMSPQLPDYQNTPVSRFAGILGTKQRLANHMDSRYIVPAAELDKTQPRYIICAELPASNDSIRNV